MLTRRTLLLGPALLAGCRRPKGAGFDGYALVANQEGQALAIVDLSAFVVLKHIRLEGKPSAVQVHAQRHAAYALTPENGAVHEIDLAQIALRRRHHVARSAISMHLAPDGTALWVLCREPRQLVRLDLASFKLDARIALPADPTDLHLAPSGPMAVISYGESRAIGFVDMAARRALPPVGLGRRLSFARYRSDGRQILVGNLDDRMLSILEADTGRVVVHLPLGVRPDYFCFKADGGQLFLAGEGMDAVAVVYPYSTEVAETVLAGRRPGAMAAVTSADFDYLFVANPVSGDVTILDLETRRAIAAVSVGKEPAFVAVTPDNQYALVLNRQSGDMAVIRIAAITAKRARSAPLFTMIPIGSQPVCAAVAWRA